MASQEGKTLFYVDSGQFSQVTVVSDTSDESAYRMRLRVTRRIQDGPRVWKEGDEFDIMRRKSVGAWGGAWRLHDHEGNDVVTYGFGEEDHD